MPPPADEEDTSSENREKDEDTAAVGFPQDASGKRGRTPNDGFQMTLTGTVAPPPQRKAVIGDAIDLVGNAAQERKLLRALGGCVKTGGASFSCGGGDSAPPVDEATVNKDAALERRRFEDKRYDELFEETHRAVARLKGPALEVDKGDSVSSDLEAAKRFADWWRANAPTYEVVESMSLDSRLVDRRLEAWFDACLDRFPSIEKMYLAEENVQQR